MAHNNDTMMAMTIIAKIRTHTAANPIKSRTLEQIYGITGERVREIVHDARMAGHPIGSGPSGYFECKTFKEWEPTRDHLHSRAMAMLSLLKRVDEGFADKQMELM